MSETPRVTFDRRKGLKTIQDWAAAGWDFDYRTPTYFGYLQGLNAISSSDWIINIQSFGWPLNDLMAESLRV
jgi:hypothetical protein